MLFATEVVFAFATVSTAAILLLKWIDRTRAERIIARRLRLVSRSEL